MFVDGAGVGWAAEAQDGPAKHSKLYAHCSRVISVAVLDPHRPQKRGVPHLAHKFCQADKI